MNGLQFTYDELVMLVMLDVAIRQRMESKQVKGLEHYQAMCKSALDKVREETRRQELNM